MAEANHCWTLVSSCPSESDKDAYEIAQTWVSEGYLVAQEKFDEIAKRNHLKDYEAVMLAQKVVHHKGQLERVPS